MIETSTKCSKYTVHQLCLTGRSQAENSRHSNKLTAKRQRLPDRGRSPRAPPRVHFRPPPSRPAKDDRNQVPHALKREIPCTQAVARHHERPQTIMALISRVPAPMLGTTKNFRPNARDPPRTRLNNTTSQFSLPSTGDPCIIHKIKMDPSSPNANSIMWTHTSLEIKFKIK